jgi:hypothetical protein
MIEWLMQVVAVAWMGAMLIMLLKVLDDGTAPRADGDDEDPLPPVCRKLDVGRRPIRGPIDSGRHIRPGTRAHRGNARELSAVRALADRRQPRRARAVQR